jgi:hypothetical protein
MTDDAAEHPTAPTSSLTIPQWFPKELKETARRMHVLALKSSDHTLALVERLIKSPRMENVWQQLSKRQRQKYRAAENFHHKAQPPFHNSLRPSKDIQYSAMRELFVWICMAAHWSWLLQTASPSYSKRAEQLRADAVRVSHSRLSRKGAKLANRLVRAASAYEELGQLPSFDDHRTVVADIVLFMRERFRSPMYGLTAAIASVALEREITASKVREWSRRTKRTKAKRSMGNRAKKLSIST